MRKICVGLLLCGLFCPFFGFSSDEVPSSNLGLNLFVYGKSSQQEVHRAGKTGAELDVKFGHQFSHIFSFESLAGLRLETGSLQAAYDDESAPKSTPVLYSAEFRVSPLPWLELNAGALDQNRWGMPRFIKDQSFPGALETLKYQVSELILSLEAEQAVVSTGFFQTYATSGALPQFYFERLGVSWGARAWGVGAHAGHFLFETLPDSVAYRSALRGNSSRGAGESATQFAYAFQGFSASANIEGKVPRWMEASLSGDFVSNLRAPQDSRQALGLTLKTKWTPLSAVVLEFAASIFRTESDSSPAFLNDEFWGHNNRRGWSIEAAAFVPEWKTRFSVAYVEAGVIRSNPYQSFLRGFQLRAGFNYDLL